MTILSSKDIVKNLKNCAEYLTDNDLSLSWEGLNETVLKGGQELFTAPTWSDFISKLNYLRSRGLGPKELRVAIIRWSRNQQEMLLKSVILEQVKNETKVLVVTNPEEFRNFFVDAWIAKELLPLTEDDFKKFVRNQVVGQEIFLGGIPARWSDPVGVSDSFDEAAQTAWKKLSYVGFDFKNTIANFFSMLSGRANELQSTVKTLIHVDVDFPIKKKILRELCRGFYQHQSRVRQQVTPRIFFAWFVYSSSLEGITNKKELSWEARRLGSEFLMEEMLNGMKSTIRLYKEFIFALLSKRIVFHKLLPVKLQFPAIRSLVLISSAIVLMVEETSNGFKPRKILGLEGGPSE